MIIQLEVILAQPGTFKVHMSAQKGPFGLKQTQTGRKAPELPTTPQERHHKTL